MTDAKLEKEVRVLAGKRGWRIAHAKANLGFPCHTELDVAVWIDKEGDPFSHHIGTGENNEAALASLKEVMAHAV